MVATPTDKTSEAFNFILEKNNNASLAFIDEASLKVIVDEASMRFNLTPIEKEDLKRRIILQKKIFILCWSGYSPLSRLLKDIDS